MIKKYEVKIPFKVLIKGLFLNEDYRKKLTNFLKEYFNGNIILTSSGSSAIYIALKDIRKRCGGEYVITSNYSCKAIPRTIIKAGFKPIFVDVDKSLSFNKNLLNKAIKENKEKIAAIISWHPEGFVFNREIIEICKKSNIPLIEDCASSFALIDKRIVGNYGDYSIFSFRTGKLFHGGGGALVSKKDIKIKLKNKNPIVVLIGLLDLFLRKFYNWEKPKAIFDHFFDKTGATKIANREALMVYYQIKNLEEIRKKRIRNYEIIKKNNSGKNILNLQRGNIEPIPTSFILLEEKRELFINYMKKRGIKITKDHNHVNSDCFEGKVYGSEVSREIAKKIAHIPVHEGLKNEEIIKIIKAIKKWNSLKN